MISTNERVVLRPLSLEDTDSIVRWRNADFVKKNLYTQDELTSEQHIEYFHRFVETQKVIQFIISVQENDLSLDIGTTFLKNIDKHNKKAEYGVFIGEKDALGKGFGKIATKLTLDYAFISLDLNRVYLSVFADNVSAIKAYEKSGFFVEGKLIQDHLRCDGYADVIIMGITREMWLSEQII